MKCQSTTNNMKTHPGSVIRLALSLAALALNFVVTQQSNAVAFTTTGPLNFGRAGHSATLLPNGTVLVVGGYNGAIRLTSAELYDPAAGTWTPTGAMATGRTTHTTTLLPNGKVLATGGHVSSAGSTSTCELYDPAAETWKQTGAMITARGNHTATLLLNGKVLVAGGFNRNTGSVVFTAEIYDPATETWTAAGAMAAARNFHTATLLLDGRVLVAGGAPDALQYTSLASAEVYDPATDTWTAIGSMSSARQAPSATLLTDGRVLIAGGYDQGYFGSGAELCDPVTGLWTGTGALGSARGVHTATLLPDGKVLVAGGNHNTFSAPAIVALSSAELYDPATGTWTASGSLNAARSTHTSILLPSGQVLVVAGFNFNLNVWLTSAELYGSAAGPITLLNPMKLPDGAFRFAFTGAANGTNTILTSANAALPLSNWTALGIVPEVAPGLYVFSDPEAAGNSVRFYRLRSP
jgi:N-acetylneuraminic acid mutarotase